MGVPIGVLTINETGRRHLLIVRDLEQPGKYCQSEIGLMEACPPPPPSLEHQEDDGCYNLLCAIRQRPSLRLHLTYALKQKNRHSILYKL